jgi:hypothetical protein
MFIKKIKKLYNKNSRKNKIEPNIFFKETDKEILIQTTKKAMRFLIFCGLLFFTTLIGYFIFCGSVKANIYDDFTIKAIQIAEGYSPKCKPDNKPDWSSGGHGSHTLCDTEAKILLSIIKGINREEALKDLKERYETEFKRQILREYNTVLKQHKKTKYDMSFKPQELSALIIFVYHRGIGYANKTNIFNLIYSLKIQEYKKENIEKVVEKILDVFLHASCRYDFTNKKTVFDKGLFARSYATSMIFFEGIQIIDQSGHITDQFSSTKDYAAKAVDTKKDKYINILVKKTTQYCNSLNNN